MRLMSERRAQSIQVGAVLLFGILIIVLSLYQAFVVPDQNEEIEFDHNQEVQQELTEIRSAIISMPEAGTSKSVSLGLGVQYPSRTIFMNPGPASGSFRTVDTTNESVAFSIDNAVAAGATSAFWNGSERQYNTGSLEYRPQYNLYDNAPRTVYEHSVLFNAFDRENEQLPLTDQAIIDGNRITLVAINGSLSENRVGSMSVDVRPVSTQTRTVRVQNTTGEQVILEIPTTLSELRWQELLVDEPRVEEVTSPSNGTVEIRLEPGTYRLQLAKVGIGTGVTTPEKAYLTDAPNELTRLEEGKTGTVTTEVRDRFNRPVTDGTVHAAADQGTIEHESVETDEDGRAAFEYTAPAGVDEDDIHLSYRGNISEIDHDTANPEDISVTIDIEEATAADGGTYELDFTPDRIDDQTGVDCDQEEWECFVTIGASLDLITTTSPGVTGATVDFSLGQGGPAKLNPSTNETDSEGDARTEISAVPETEDEDRVTVHANSAGGGDTLVVEFEATAIFGVSINESESDPGVTVGETATVAADINNFGEEADTQNITLEIHDSDGTLVHTATEDDLTLAGGEMETVAFDWDTTGEDPGTYDATISSEDDEGTHEITVSEAGHPNFAIRIDETNSPVGQGGTLNVTATIDNIGDETGTQDITLDIDGTEEDRIQDLTLADGADETVYLEWETQPGDVGTYEANVSSEDDWEIVTVEITPAIYPDSYTRNAGGDFTDSDFENMQAEDGEVAEFRGEGGTAFDVDIVTEDVPDGEYELELGVEFVSLQGQSDGIDVIVTDESGTEIADRQIDEDDANSQIQLNIGEIDDGEEITVTYIGDHNNDQLDIDYQRLVAQ